MSQSAPTPSLSGRAKRWMKLLKRRSRSSSTGPEEKGAAEMFANAQNFTINGGQFINQFINEMKVNYINDVVSNRQAVFELLEPYACLDATKDSSARYPPPKCHPQTRLKIRERLMHWLSNEEAEQKMLWVRGSAGTGKSAVAQSFGDTCEEEEIFGGSYFFSRVANRNKLQTVVPTLVCQLAENAPAYRALIGHRLADNPLLLRKSLPIQFRKLIVEPFATLQRQGHRKQVAIILDGLDECEGEDAQLEIIEMITNAIRSNPDLPLRWVIFSRPEAHLKNKFSRNLLCGREELVIDSECWEDVERYVKERLAEIKNGYKDVVPSMWPSDNQVQELLDAVSGLFVLASTCLNFIADPEGADPPSRLTSLLKFMKRSQDIVSRNPLAALDLLYSQILEKIPSTVYQTTRRLLGYICYQNSLDKNKWLKTTQLLSNFLRLDRQTFYTAVRGLYSVMSIPEHEDAALYLPQFYHASFQDFLLDPTRSSKFAISEQEALSDAIQFSCYWYDVDATHFHKHDGWDFVDENHNHDDLPDLAWVQDDNQKWIFSRSIMKFIDDGVLYYTRNRLLDVANNRLLSQLASLDFRYWRSWDVFDLVIRCQLDPSTSTIVRVEPSTPTDQQLLKHFNTVIRNEIAKPAIFPLRHPFPDGQWIREYFFIGYGVKSVILWRTKSPWLCSCPHSIRCDQEPSDAQISRYVRILRKIRWHEEKAQSEMK